MLELDVLVFDIIGSYLQIRDTQREGDGVKKNYHVKLFALLNSDFKLLEEKSHVCEIKIRLQGTLSFRFIS
jgi:hypothetical protein